VVGGDRGRIDALDRCGQHRAADALHDRPRPRQAREQARVDRRLLHRHLQRAERLVAASHEVARRREDGGPAAGIGDRAVAAREDDPPHALLLDQGVQARLQGLAVVRAQRLRQHHVAADLRGGGLRAVVVLVVEVDRRAVGGRQTRVGLPALVVGDEPEEDERHRHHRDHDDEDEEERQPVAKAHGRSCADDSRVFGGPIYPNAVAPERGLHLATHPGL
jgi:hypothetical protein